MNKFWNKTRTPPATGTPPFRARRVSRIYILFPTTNHPNSTPHPLNHSNHSTKNTPGGVFFKFGTPLYIKTPVCYILAWRQDAKGVSYPACLLRTNRAGSPFSLMGTDPVGFSASSSQLLSRYHSP